MTFNILDKVNQELVTELNCEVINMDPPSQLRWDLCFLRQVNSKLGIFIYYKDNSSISLDACYKIEYCYYDPVLEAVRSEWITEMNPDRVTSIVQIIETEVSNNMKRIL